MTINPRFPSREEMRFQNVSESGFSLEQVFRRILRFISQHPQYAYHFVIGTDSQVHKGCTMFVTGIVIHRLGKGAWACYREVVIPRELTSIKEKLSMETTLSQEVASYFTEEEFYKMEEPLLPYVYKGASLETFIDIDAGTIPVINKTAQYVQEMVERVNAMGTYEARVKPDAYAASSYANRYTKKGIREVHP
ncbi:ribonuclease H-like YkuK family protein [Paenibacillus senegalensis]|uniref:ribonuclease H-like YkuK family protein n=1 Tax=Paenibacillus senegalensis TaxID=1465766 RepID=UPI0002D3C47E|nr:ribonuclease H-like YkuK family protein [Paenibacillus senegalensis]